MAYTSVKEIRMADTNLHEIKCVAGLINYKYCALMFRLNEPRDALNQLKNHMRLYKPVVGPDSLLFEHYAWLAAQYAAFADLFNEAIGQVRFIDIDYNIRGSHGSGRGLVVRAATTLV